MDDHASTGDSGISRRAALRSGATVATVTTLGLATVAVRAQPTDSCPRSPGYWKNHWHDYLGGRIDMPPVGSLTKSEIQDLLQAPAKGDTITIMAKQYVATYLNLLLRPDPDGACANAAVAVGGIGTVEWEHVKNSAQHWLRLNGWEGTTDSGKRDWTPTVSVEGATGNVDGETLKDALEEFNKNGFDALDCDCRDEEERDEGGGSPPTDAGPGVVFTQNGALRSISSTDSTVTDWTAPDANENRRSIDVIGAMTADFDGDGSIDIPYLKNKSSLRIIDQNQSDNSPRKINIAVNKADTQKTALAMGSWDGSKQSIFYVGQGHSTIYRVAPDNSQQGSSQSPVTVATPENGANMALGPGDIDGDKADELVFVDGSQTVRYIESNGNIKSTGVTVGSSNNIGAGPPTDFDDDGTASVPIVDGSNQIKLVDAAGTEATIITGSDGEQAAKSHLATFDIDDDDEVEIIYLENNESPAHLKYVDDVRGTNTFKMLYDEVGERIEADKKRGVA